MKTDSIIELLKNTENVEQTLINIKKLSINRFGYDEELANIEFQELKLLPNLEELNIFDCSINTETMTTILQLKKLIQLNFYNCEFLDEPEYFFENLNIKDLTISNCNGLDNTEFKNLQKLSITGNTKYKSIETIQTLNIVKGKITNDIYNINKIIINQSQNITDDVAMDIVILDEYGEVVSGKI